jgi:NADH-quinone oxidoreductase subunit N
MNLGAFLVITRLAQEGKDPGIEEFQGLSKRSPFLAFIFLLSVFSLAGIPPLIGFTGKWILFKSALDAGFPLLVIWAMVNSTISLYYYLIFVKAAYLKEPRPGQTSFNLRISEKIVGFIILLAIILWGIYPTPLYQIVETAVEKLVL